MKSESKTQELISMQAKFKSRLGKELKRVKNNLISKYGISRRCLSLTLLGSGGIIKCGGSIGIANAVFLDSGIRDILNFYNYSMSLNAKSYEGQYRMIHCYASIVLKQDPKYWNWTQANFIDNQAQAIVPKQLSIDTIAQKPSDQDIVTVPQPINDTNPIDASDLPWWVKY